MESVIERLAVEQKQGDDPATDGRVGKVEDGAEEDEVLSAHKGHPLGPIGVDDGEIEHIHHLAVEQGGVSSAFGQERGQLDGRALAEQHAIEDAVHDVAQRARQDEGDAHDEARLQPLLTHALVKEPGNERHRHQAEEGEEQLAENLHAEGHAHILREEDVAPVGHPDALVPIHVGLHPYLDDLVNDQDGQNDEPGDPALC